MQIHRSTLVFLITVLTSGMFSTNVLSFNCDAERSRLMQSEKRSLSWKNEFPPTKENNPAHFETDIANINLKVARKFLNFTDFCRPDGKIYQLNIVPREYGRKETIFRFPSRQEANLFDVRIIANKGNYDCFSIDKCGTSIERTLAHILFSVEKVDVSWATLEQRTKNLKHFDRIKSKFTLLPNGYSEYLTGKHHLWFKESNIGELLEWRHCVYDDKFFYKTYCYDTFLHEEKLAVMVSLRAERLINIGDIEFARGVGLKFVEFNRLN